MHERNKNKRNPIEFNRQKYNLAILHSFSYSVYNFPDKYIVSYISSIEFIIYHFNRDAFLCIENIFKKIKIK